MDTNVKYTDCDGALCALLGLCVETSNQDEMAEMVEGLMELAYRGGWQDGVESTQIAIRQQSETVDPVDLLVDEFESLLENLGEDFEAIQTWADVVFVSLNDIDDDLASLDDTITADGVLLEALAVRLADLEEENKRLWKAVLQR